MRRLEKYKITTPTNSTISSLTIISPIRFLTTHYDGTYHIYEKTSSYLDSYHKHISSSKIDKPILCSSHIIDNYSLNEKIILGTPISLLITDPSLLKTEELLNIGVVQIIKYETILICSCIDSIIRFYELKNINNILLIKTIEAPSKICSIDFDFKSNLLAVACLDKFLYTFDFIRNFQRKKYSTRFEYPIMCIQFFKPFEVVIGGVEGRIEIIKLVDPLIPSDSYYSYKTDVSNIDKNYSFKSHRSFQEAHAISYLQSSNDLLITGGSDGKIILQNIKEKSKLASCSFPYSITSMKWDGDKVFVACGENFSKGIYSDVAELYVVECSPKSFY